MAEQVDHPQHYGGEDNPFEVIEVLEALGLGWGFCVGNALKYLARAPFKGTERTDLEKARWYINRVCVKGWRPSGRTTVAADYNDQVREAWGITGGPLDDVVYLLIYGDETGIKQSLLMLEAHLEVTRVREGEAGDDEVDGEAG